MQGSANFMKRQLLLGYLLTIIIGGMIYIAFRAETLVIFKWLSKISITEPVKLLRQTTFSFKNILPNWFVFSLPDGLWLFSYVTLLLYLWDNEISKQNILWMIIIPLIAIFSELGQLLNFISGTFDPVDLTFYIFGTLLPFLIFTKSITIKF